jgi:hypothetical protein
MIRTLDRGRWVLDPDSTWAVSTLYKGKWINNVDWISSLDAYY